MLQQPVYVVATTLEPAGHYMYHQFNIQQFFVLPTQCIYVFCVDLRTNSDGKHPVSVRTGLWNVIVDNE